MPQNVSRLLASFLFAVIALGALLPAQPPVPPPSPTNPVGTYELLDDQMNPIQPGHVWEVEIVQPFPGVPIWVDVVSQDGVPSPGESAYYYPDPIYGFIYENGYGNWGSMEYCCLGIWECTMQSGRNQGKQTFLMPIEPAP